MLIAQTQHYDILLKYWFAALAVNPTEVLVPHIFEKNYLLSPENVAGIVYRFRRYIKVLQNSAGIKSSEPDAKIIIEKTNVGQSKMLNKARIKNEKFQQNFDFGSCGLRCRIYWPQWT